MPEAVEGDAGNPSTVDGWPPNPAAEQLTRQRAASGSGEHEGVSLRADVGGEMLFESTHHRATGTVGFNRAVFGSFSRVTWSGTSTAVLVIAMRDRSTSTQSRVSGRLTPAQTCEGADQHQSLVLFRRDIDQLFHPTGTGNGAASAALTAVAR